MLRNKFNTVKKSEKPIKHALSQIRKDETHLDHGNKLINIEKAFKQFIFTTGRMSTISRGR